MLHHVRDVVLSVAMQAGRCERRREGGRFHNSESERVMKLNQEEQQQVYM